MRRGLVVSLIPPNVVILLCRLSLGLTPLQSGSVVVMVVIMMTPAGGAAVGLFFVMLVVMVHTVAIAILVRIMKMVIVVQALITGLS